MAADAEARDNDLTGGSWAISVSIFTGRLIASIAA